LKWWLEVVGKNLLLWARLVWFADIGTQASSQLASFTIFCDCNKDLHLASLTVQSNSLQEMIGI
jgi:hypothetical protein